MCYANLEIIKNQMYFEGRRMGRHGEVVTSLNLSLICQNPPESPHEDAGILSTYFVSGQDSSCPKN